MFHIVVIQLPEATPPPGLRMHRKAIARPSKNRPSWAPNPFKNPSKWKPKSSKIGPRRPLGGVWGSLGAILAPRWPQGGPKRPQDLEKSILGPPLGRQVGGQNRSKIHPEAIEKVIVFLITFGIDFWSDLVPTWLQLGSQNPPKMEPSWDQNPCKLGC